MILPFDVAAVATRARASERSTRKFACGEIGAGPASARLARVFEEDGLPMPELVYPVEEIAAAIPCDPDVVRRFLLSEPTRAIYAAACRDEFIKRGLPLPEKGAAPPLMKTTGPTGSRNTTAHYTGQKKP